jgi:hypothetical protein
MLSTTRHVIVAFGGLKGSGKSTLGGYLMQHWGFTPEAFATPIKKMVQLAFPQVEYDQLFGSSNRREELIPGTNISVRAACQTLGTEWGRDMMYPGIWVDALFARVAPLPASTRIVITDCRFEAAEVKARGGLTVLLTRGMKKRPTPLRVARHVLDFYEPLERDNHASEEAVLLSRMDDWSYVLDNTSDLNTTFDALDAWALRQSLASELPVRRVRKH